MPRVLTVSRASVPARAEAEYLRVAGELARLSQARGRNLWLFRAPGREGAYLECSESGTVDRHRVRAAPADEARLERRLRELAAYAPDAWDIWEEVAL